MKKIENGIIVTVGFVESAMKTCTSKQEIINDILAEKYNIPVFDVEPTEEQIASVQNIPEDKKEEILLLTELAKDYLDLEVQYCLIASDNIQKSIDTLVKDKEHLIESYNNEIYSSVINPYVNNNEYFIPNEQMNLINNLIESITQKAGKMLESNCSISLH